MEHSDSYTVIKKQIEVGQYEKKLKQLFEQLIALREHGQITEEEHAELIGLATSFSAKKSLNP